MRSGQRKARRKWSSLNFKKLAKKRFMPHSYLEGEIVYLEKLGDAARALWRDFQNYLVNEREKILEQIKEALLETSCLNYSQKHLSRIIDSEFSKNPLSSKGSYLHPPGGRFNIGQSISYKNYFPALYIANDYDVAFCEKFHCKEDIEKEKGRALEFALKKPESFTHQRVNIFLEKIIDLRKDDSLQAFFEVVKHIKMPLYYKEQAKKLQLSMSMAKNVTQLRSGILEPFYQQWDYWLDCPSSSQWFGHYVRLAKIQGIIYPSIKSESGFNVAIFPDQFEESSSYVELSDESDFVEDTSRRPDTKNFQLFL